MLLTIGMIVKNEEKYLERCLNGIKPILEQVDSELIIADTGSTDRTVEIAKKFTDNVFYFEWIKDFSAARNSTLEKAQGEWFMYVDADEIFESCDEIIHFFNSGEYRKYNSASYIQRNLLNAGGEEKKDVRYSDFRAPRMTKILQGTKFINPIHETLNTYCDPIKLLDDYVIHYGYSYTKDAKESKEKFKRNTDLLVQRYNNGERSGALYLQLFESFTLQELETADKYLREGIEYCRKNKDGMLVVLMEKYTTRLYDDKKYEEILEEYDRYCKLDKKFHPTVMASDVDMAAAKALALTNLNRHEEAIRYYLKFFALVRDYNSGKISAFDTFSTCRDFARPDNFMAALYMFTKSCLEAEKYDAALDRLSSLPIDKYSMIPEQVEDLIVLEMKLLDKCGYENAPALYKRFDGKGKEFFKNELMRRLGSEKSADICSALLKTCQGDENTCGVINTVKAFFEGGAITAAELAEAAEKADMPVLLYIGLVSRADISPLLGTESFDVRAAVVHGYKYIKDFHSAMESYSADCISDREKLADFAELLIYAMNAAITVKRVGGGFIVRSLDKLFELYGAVGIEKTALAKEIAESRRAKDYKTCIAKMREIIEIYPELTTVIAEYRRGVISEYEAAQPMNEMQRLAAMIKSNIRNYIASGNTDAAAKTLAEYEKINPNDPDIAGLKEAIKPSP